MHIERRPRITCQKCAPPYAMREPEGQNRVNWCQPMTWALRKLNGIKEAQPVEPEVEDGFQGLVNLAGQYVLTVSSSSAMLISRLKVGREKSRGRPIAMTDDGRRQQGPKPRLHDLNDSAKYAWLKRKKRKYRHPAAGREGRREATDSCHDDP